MDKYTNMLLLDEALSYLNSDNNDETVNESVIGGLLALLIAPYILVLPIVTILYLASKISSSKDEKALKEFLSEHPNFISDINKASKLMYNNVIKKRLGKYSKYLKLKDVKKDDIIIHKNQMRVYFMYFDASSFVNSYMGTDDYSKICNLLHWDQPDDDPNPELVREYINDSENSDDLSDSEKKSVLMYCDKLDTMLKDYDNMVTLYRSLNKEVSNVVNGVNITLSTDMPERYDEYMLSTILLDNEGKDLYYVIPIKDYSKMELPDNISKAIKKKIDQAK